MSFSFSKAASTSASIYPSNQGLKRQISPSLQSDHLLRIYLSIKSRIETSHCHQVPCWAWTPHLSIHQIKDWNKTCAEQSSTRCFPPHLSIHQIKDWNTRSLVRQLAKIFLRIYLSIKSRIETVVINGIWQRRTASASIYPSNQGLKPIHHDLHQLPQWPPHLSIHQIKDWNQSIMICTNSRNGLRIYLSIKSRIETYEVLKNNPNPGTLRIYLSIKSRIETSRWWGYCGRSRSSASIYPSNQGLKHLQIRSIQQPAHPPHLSIHQIKDWNKLSWNRSGVGGGLRIYLSIKSRIETLPLDHRKVGRWNSASIYPSNQGLKRACSQQDESDKHPPHLSIHQIKDWNANALKNPKHTIISASIYPSNQGLKPRPRQWRIGMNKLRIYLSIKSRVETEKYPPQYPKKAMLYPSIHQIKGWNNLQRCWSRRSCPALSINPSNQGLKQIYNGANRSTWIGSIHQSIKSRVETLVEKRSFRICDIALSINPSNQGLKHGSHQWSGRIEKLRIYLSIKSRIETGIPLVKFDLEKVSASIYPSNQGLKLFPWILDTELDVLRIYLSIKSRIETYHNGMHIVWFTISASIYPSNQGLKLDPGFTSWGPHITPHLSIHQIKDWNSEYRTNQWFNFQLRIYLSIKSRIETAYLLNHANDPDAPHLSIHQIKDWNIQKWSLWICDICSASIYPSNQGLKPPIGNTRKYVQILRIYLSIKSRIET